MPGPCLRHRPATAARLPLLVAHAALCLAAAPRHQRQRAILPSDRVGLCSAAARAPTAALAAAAANRVCSAAMAPVERQPGEWESPITSQLITSAVRQDRRCISCQTPRAGDDRRVPPPNAAACCMAADQAAGGGELCCQWRPVLAGGAASREGSAGAGPQVRAGAEARGSGGAADAWCGGCMVRRGRCLRPAVLPGQSPCQPASPALIPVAGLPTAALLPT